MNNKIIDLFVIAIGNHFEQYKESHGYVDRSFFESVELKNKLEVVRSNCISMGFPEISDEKFSQYYDAAIKECRHKKQAGMTPSVSLTGADARKKTWLNAERTTQLKWDGESRKSYRNRYMEYLAEIGEVKHI